MDRREFSKIILLGGLAARYLLFCKNSEKKREGLSLSAINTWIDKDAASADLVLDRIELLFRKEEHIDFVLTPEYSFYDINRPLRIKKERDRYIMHDTNDFIREKVDRASNLACKYNSNLFLGTFAEIDEKGGRYNTLLQIGPEGKIRAKKRKSYFLEDEYKFKAKNKKTYRVLPLICSDLFEEKIRKEMMGSKEKYDILAYTANLGVKFSNLSKYLQGLLDRQQIDENSVESEIRNFKEYFGKYNENILNKGKIVISDGAWKDLGAILKSDLNPFPYYQSKKEYVLTRL